MPKTPAEVVDDVTVEAGPAGLAPRSTWRSVMDFISSLKLTVVLLAIATLLVFAGTIAQVEQGLYQAQARYFKSLFIFFPVPGTGWSVPVFPGGYLLGTLMLINLTAATVRRLRLTRDNFGLWMIHAGLILLLLGQLFTDVLSVESAMPLRIGETRSYSEDFHANELAVIETTDPREDRLTSFPESLVRREAVLSIPDSPIALKIRNHWVNAEVLESTTAGGEASGATQGVGQGQFVRPVPPVTRMEERNLPAALVDILAGPTNLGTWLLSSRVVAPQTVTHQGRTWQIALRPKRHYTAHSITLLDCQHDVYPGTEIPKNFSSRVRVRHAQTGEDREVLIYMNNPLRYGGNTYYQYQMAAQAPVKTSTLQVVRNPGWLTPYLSCALVGVGLVLQFMMHLVGFLKRRRHET